MTDEPKDILPTGPDDEGDDDPVIVRRIDRRLAARAESDRPWLRRIVGLAVIVAAFAYGWKSLNSQSSELIKRTRAQNRSVEAAPRKTEASVPTKLIMGVVTESKTGMSAAEDAKAQAFLDPETVNIIADCTKGQDALKSISVGRADVESGQTTLESIFTPALDAGKNQTKRIIDLQNIRIRTKDGEEWRLHATTSKGLKLFRVAEDGLPEEIPFPENLSDLAGKRIDDDVLTRFLALAQRPGEALEVERHESWHFADKSGAQIIWSGDHIFDIQLYLRNAFLACSRGTKSGSATVSCQCLPHPARPGP